MAEIIPVVQLAKERALFRFSALAFLMLQDANLSIAQASANAGTLQEQKTLSASKSFLQDQGQDFLKRLNASYVGYVERGMQTMYRDLRQNLAEISAETLTLMDDDTMTRHIEVERRVLRLRDADQQSLSRLNLMIAKIHGEHEIRERENPFRPYLMARALHDVLCGMVATNNICTMLFDHLSGALCNHLPEYFAAIRAVFESHGVHAQLLARPSALSKRDREMLAEPVNQAAPNMLFTGAGIPDNFVLPAGASVAPSGGFPTISSSALEHIESLLEKNGIESSKDLPSQTALQDFVWKIFNQSAPGRVPASNRLEDCNTIIPFQPDAHPLVERLQKLQKSVLTADTTQIERSFDLRDELGLNSNEDTAVDENDRVAADVVDILFKFIAADESIPEKSRLQIARLQAPFLKASILDADVLQSPAHPARKLLNRVTSLSIGLDEKIEPGTTALKLITETINHILRDFTNDVDFFGTALRELNNKVGNMLRTFDSDVALAADALEEAEKDPDQYDVVLGHTVAALRERLSTLQTDPRAEEFIIKVWSKVLAYVSQHASIESKPYLDAISELIWSVQINLDASERAALMRLLPKLAVRLREGLALIEMPEDESKRVQDTLVAMHSQVLRSVPDPLQYSMRLGSLVQHFAKMQIGAPNETVAALHAPMIPAPRLQSALQKFDVDARAYIDTDVGTLMSEDAQWLGGMKPGTSIEWWSERGYLPATLMWVDEPQSFYLFHIDPEKQPEDHPGLLIYSSISLIKALREGSISMIEAAPVFDRAIESLLLNSEDVQQLEPA
jgi:hypothetical protein